MRTSVVLPDPFGPSRPNRMPAGIRRSTPATAVTRPYLFISPCVAITSTT